THAEELQRKAVLYLNSDTNSRGFLAAAGSHSLQRLVNEVANGVQDPETGVSSQARLRARLMVSGYEKGATDQDKKLAKLAAAGGDLPIKALGSGSDFTPFIQHLGVTTLSIEYGGAEGQEGGYDSNYVSVDPNLLLGI